MALAALLTLSVPATAASQGSGKQDVPTELFGIKVGQDYNIGNPDTGDLGDFPVKKFAGIQIFMGSGLSYYFEPLKANEMFEYVESRKKPDDRFFTTSFRAYLYPVIPESIQDIDRLKKAWPTLKQRVALIEWQMTSTKADDAYYRAIDLCETFSAGFAVKPKISDIDKWYNCTFTSGEREFDVRNSGDLLSVSLSLRDDIRNKLDKEVDSRIRGLKSKALLK